MNLSVLVLLILVPLTSSEAVDFYYNDNRHLGLIEAIPIAEPGSYCVTQFKDPSDIGIVVDCDPNQVKRFSDNGNFIWLKGSDEVAAELFTIKMMAGKGYDLVNCSLASAPGNYPKCYFKYKEPKEICLQ